MKKFQLKVRLPGNVYSIIYIVAENGSIANRMAEAQYGRGNIAMSATYVSMA